MGEGSGTCTWAEVEGRLSDGIRGRMDDDRNDRKKENGCKSSLDVSPSLMAVTLSPT